MTWILALLFWLAAPQTPAGVSGVTITGRAGEETLLSSVRVRLTPEFAIPAAPAAGGAGPAARATVVAYEVDSDADGNFAFPSIAPGRYVISAEKEGYFRGETSTASAHLNIAERQTLDGITLKLSALPAITGIVYGPGGRPLTASTVRAYRVQFTPRGRQLSLSSTALTNERGEYRLFHLSTGSYVVTASYGDRWLRPWTSTIRLSENLPSQDDGYSTVYYTSSLTSAGATVVPVVDENDTSNINITFRDSRYFKLSIQLITPPAPPPGCPGLENVGVAVMPRGSDLGSALDYRVENHQGIFSVDRLPEGEYIVVALRDSVDGQGKRSATIVSDPQEIKIAKDTEVKIPVILPFDVPGSITLASLGARSGVPSLALPRGVQLQLIRADNLMNQIYLANVDPGGNFYLKDVSPGTYDVLVHGLPPDVFISDAGFSTSNRRLIQATIDFTRPSRDWIGTEKCLNLTSRDPLRVTLSTMSVMVSGTVSGYDGRKAMNALVVLAPTDPTVPARKDRFFTTVSDSTGAFQLPNVPRGMYVAYALESADSDIYFDSVFNSHIGPKGLPVNVVASSLSNVNLTLITVNELKNIAR